VPPLKSVNRKLDALFLRLYANNLARSFRSDPANACADSEIQMTTAVLIVMFSVFLIAGSLAFPVFLRAFLSGGDASYAVLIASTIAVAYWTHKRFGGYELTPELANEYATKQSKRWSVIGYWSIMVGFLVIAWTVLRR
jgi:hypothetical protein